MKILFSLLCVHFIQTQDISPLVDTKILSELPLEKLLQVKSTFNQPEVNPNQKSDDAPQALALIQNNNQRKPNERGGHVSYHSYQEENSKKSGKKSVQSIFQISVTTLAFLAFGGYLLCLLVQAIKGKQMMDTSTVATIAAYVQPIRRPTRRPTRRPPRRYQKRPKPEKLRPKRDAVWPEVESEDLYYALVQLSEGYVKYRTIDYKKLNYSRNFYN